MKKSFSIITMLLIAFIAFNVTAQTYDIIGTWEGKSVKDENNSNKPMKGELSFIQTFNADSSGFLNFIGNLSGNIDPNTQLKINLKGKCPFSWTINDSTIIMKLDSSNFEVVLTENDIEFICNDLQTQALMNAYKPQMVQMFNQQSKSLISSSIGSGSEWTIVSLEGDNMTILEKGNEYNLTRVK